MKMKKILTVCLALTAFVTATAQTPQVRITLDEAIRIALDDNPTIKIADLEIQRQEYVRRETWGNHLPQLSVAGTYNYSAVETKISKDSEGSLQSKNTVQAVANLTIPLFAPGVYKTLKLNDEQMRAAVEAARGSRIDLVNEVKKAYYNIMLAEQSLDVLYSSRATIQETVDDTRVKYENGLAAEYDLITAEVQLSNLRPTIIQTENSIEIAKKLLKMYMNLPLDLDIEVTGDLEDYAEIIDDAVYMYDIDLTNNTDLVSMDIQMDILNRQLEVLKTQRMPTLAAFGNFTLMGQNDLDFSSLFTGGEAALKPFFWQVPVALGLSLNVPIFAGTTNIQRERQLKNNIAQLDYQRDYLHQSVNVQMSDAINSLITAREMMKANSLTVVQAQKGYDISRTRYNAGMGTILEVNSAELSLTQAKLNYTQSIYDYLSAQADYEKIKGEELY